MKNLTRISFIILAVIISCAMPGQVYSHGGGGGGGRGGSFGNSFGGGRYDGGYGRGWGGGWGLGLWGLGYPYYGYPFYPYYDGLPSTDVYVNPAPQQTLPSGTGYWYYCQNPQGYYPYVKQCQNDWMEVAPSPPTQQR